MSFAHITLAPDDVNLFSTTRYVSIYDVHDQVLPLYLVDQRNHQRAHTACARAVKVIAEKTGNARPSDGIPTNRSGRRAMPTPGAYAAGAGAPVAPSGAPPPAALAQYMAMIQGGGGMPPEYGPPPGFADY